jgi:serine/threonine-protein kinase
MIAAAVNEEPWLSPMATDTLSLQGLSVELARKQLAVERIQAPSWLFRNGAVSPLLLEQLILFLREYAEDPPARLGDLIALRIERLRPDIRLVLQTMSVIGNEVDVELLGRVLPKGLDLRRASAGLVGAKMILDQGKVLCVSHPLIREVALGTIPAEARIRLHRSVFELLDEMGGAIEVRAMHACNGQDAFSALILLERVGSQAEARGDMVGSIAALKRGLEVARAELVRGELDDPMRAVAIFGRKLGEALLASKQYIDAEGVLREALDMAGPKGEERVRILGALARLMLARGRVQESRQLVTAASCVEDVRNLSAYLRELREAVGIEGHEPSA